MEFEVSVFTITITETLSGTRTIMTVLARCEVDVNRAGEGELEIMVNKGTVANSVRMMSAGVFQVSFVPKEPKPHTVDIKFNSAPLPGTARKIPVLLVADWRKRSDGGYCFFIIS